MTRFFTKSIAKTAIVTALSASLAFSPVTATPAHAGNDDAAAIAAASFFALITAGIIASAANQNSWKFDTDRGGNRGNRGHARKALPAKCELNVRGGPDRGNYFGTFCLKRNYTHVASLPARCQESIWVPRRGRTVSAYDAQCLSRFGYRTAGDQGGRR